MRIIASQSATPCFATTGSWDFQQFFIHMICNISGHNLKGLWSQKAFSPDDSFKIVDFASADQDPRGR